ncbi:hypothetical protein SteCoe_26137 [Stentor coeruleus]|uniref:RBR-type E3 ubiquitin transferase n=1 Tax=Stentor coeruleus TaxID=5963 RepID=A0A1R2BDK2_9CILI|nr:hypothetical protein SteCoe_26137 [Stentor coeruleus]
MEAEKKYCEICYETKSQEYFYINPICTHSFCVPCMKSYFMNILSTREFYSMNCPSQGCENKELMSVAKKVLSEEEYHALDESRFFFILSLDPNTRWCPVPDCKGYSHVTSLQYVSCNVCACDYCKDCLQRWEDKHKCQKANEFHVYMKNLGARPCPGCKNLVEKRSGCTSMTCRCGTIFCMVCGKIIDNNHDGLKCFIGLEDPSYLLILGLLLSPILFPFHAGFYIFRTRSFDEKDDNGKSIYNCKNLTLYFIMFVISPIIVLFIIFIAAGYVIFSREDRRNFNSLLPKTKFFWPLKPFVYVLAFVLVLVLIILGYMIFNIYLAGLGFVSLIKKLCCRKNFR